MSLTISGSCVVQTKPPGEPSTGNSAPWLDGRVDRRRKQVQPHHVAGRVVQHEIDVVERDDPREPLGEIVKEFVQVRM